MRSWQPPRRDRLCAWRTRSPCRGRGAHRGRGRSRRGARGAAGERQRPAARGGALRRPGHKVSARATRTRSRSGGGEHRSAAVHAALLRALRARRLTALGLRHRASDAWAAGVLRLYANSSVLSLPRMRQGAWAFHLCAFPMCIAYLLLLASAETGVNLTSCSPDLAKEKELSSGHCMQHAPGVGRPWPLIAVYLLPLMRPKECETVLFERRRSAVEQ